MKQRTLLRYGLYVMLMLVGLIAQSAAGTTYQWMDANGNPVLSDRPPPAGKAYVEVDSSNGFIRRPKPVIQDQPDVIGPASEVSAPASDSTADNPTASVAAGHIGRQPAVCEQAQDNILKLETLPRVRLVDEHGDVRFMTEDERTAQLAITYQSRDLHCDLE